MVRRWGGTTWEGAGSEPTPGGQELIKHHKHLIKTNPPVQKPEGTDGCRPLHPLHTDALLFLRVMCAPLPD